MKPFSTRSGDKPIATPVTPAEIQMEADVAKAIGEAEKQPSSRALCASKMEAQHAYIDALKAQLVTAQADLDGLIRLNNSLPVEHVKHA